MYRPWILDSRVVPLEEAIPDATGYSFPSGHTSSVASFCGAIAVWFRQKKWLIVLMVAIGTLVAFSRNWLGCHTPQDVLVAILVSVVVLTICWKIFGCLESNPDKDVFFAVLGIVVAIASLLFVVFRQYPLDYVGGAILVDPWEMQTDCFKVTGAFIGFCLAWIIERRCIQFQNATSLKQRVIRGVIGTALLGLTYGLLAICLVPLDVHSHKFIEYFILLIVAIDIVPLVFKTIEKRV